MKNKHVIKNNTELLSRVRQEIKENGPECDLNHLDVSYIEDFSYCFYNTDFNGYIDEWDTSNGVHFDYMFAKSKYNRPIYFNTKNAVSLSAMFLQSQFNQPLFHLKTTKVVDFSLMFALSPFNQDIQSWDLENGDNFDMMFYQSKFNQPLENFRFKKKDISMYAMLARKEYSKKLFSAKLIKDAFTFKLFSETELKTDLSEIKEVFSEEDFEAMFEI